MHMEGEGGKKRKSTKSSLDETMHAYTASDHYTIHYVRYNIYITTPQLHFRHTKHTHTHTHVR